MGSQRVWKLFRAASLVGVTVAVVFGAVGAVAAQALNDVKTPDTPLVLKAQGSFFVGGEKVEQSQSELGNLGPGGHIAVNQMYVRFMVPRDGADNLPVVMVHGATLTGKSWETTPDGRMGWDEYFVRRGHPVYVPDQVGRGRSGFNQAVFNNVRAGSTPAASQPVWLRFSDESVWPNFRFGLKPGVPYPDSQFPVAAVDELAKQGVPDMNRGLPSPTPTIKALSDLAVQLKGAVLMGHSQSGSFPLEAALVNPAATKGLVLVAAQRPRADMNLFTAMFTAVALLASVSTEAQTIAITRGGSRAVSPAAAEHFTGSVRVEALFEALDPSHASGGSVTFESGARTAWHSHPRGQILIVTAGTGRVQRWGDPRPA